jgi:arylsulfatase A-like enzyme
VARVVFLIVDALPPRHISSRVTPTLAALAREGGSSTGRAVMTSATYPNHATFATGADPLGHRLLANWVAADGHPRPANEVGPAAPTIFDACRATGRSSIAVVGDQHLIGVMGAHAADEHWPIGGVLGDDVARDDHGYVADREVVPRVLDVLDHGAPDLLVVHLNEPDTAAHRFGPDSDRALECYRSTDASVAIIVEALRSRWDDTVLAVVSDHDQEDVDADGVIDLYPPAAATGLPLIPIPEGSAAVVWGDDESDGAWLDAIDGVAGHEVVWPGARLVHCDRRRWFCPPAGFSDGPPEPGTHGSLRTRAQVAIAAGGHHAAALLARTLNDRDEVDATAWAPTVMSLLGIEPGALRASGASLVADQ